MESKSPNMGVFEQLLADIKDNDIIPITFSGQYPGYLRYAFGYEESFEIADRGGWLEELEVNFRTLIPPHYLDPATVERWQCVYELGKKRVTSPKGVGVLDHIQAQMQVVQGDAAMALTGSYISNEMKDSIPDGF